MWSQRSGDDQIKIKLIKKKIVLHCVVWNHEISERKRVHEVIILFRYRGTDFPETTSSKFNNSTPSAKSAKSLIANPFFCNK